MYAFQQVAASDLNFPAASVEFRLCDARSKPVPLLHFRVPYA
jgi:hypothetical protein